MLPTTPPSPTAPELPPLIINHEPIETACVLDHAINRTVGTLGFIGGLMLYFTCCACEADHKHVSDTYNDHTVCGIMCPMP
jgi:hypothetical protein